MKKRPAIERLREVLAYEAGTGVLRWRVTNSNVALAGSEAGSRDGRYVRVMVDGVRMLAHRVIWAIVTGGWPPSDIDHEDGDGYNNRWRNLRPSTMPENIANSKISKRNSTKFKGVARSRGRFRAQIGSRYIGVFATAQAAHDAYMAEAIRIYGEFARAS